MNAIDGELKSTHLNVRLTPPKTVLNNSGITLTVLFTKEEPTRAALKKTASLAHQLNTNIRLVAIVTVPYALPINAPAVPVEFYKKRLKALIQECSIDANIQLYLCRDPMKTLKMVLPPNSIVIVGEQPRWWPTAEKRLAKQIRHAGFEVIRIRACA